MKPKSKKKLLLLLPLKLLEGTMLRMLGKQIRAMKTRLPLHHRRLSILLSLSLSLSLSLFWECWLLSLSLSLSLSFENVGCPLFWSFYIFSFKKKIILNEALAFIDPYFECSFSTCQYLLFLVLIAKTFSWKDLFHNLNWKNL